MQSFGAGPGRREHWRVENEACEAHKIFARGVGPVRRFGRFYFKFQISEISKVKEGGLNLNAARSGVGFSL